MNRKNFPILKKYIYLDSAAGSLKPKCVVEAIANFYLNYPINPHSPDSKIGIKVLQEITETRKLIANYIEAQEEEIIFTAGTTDSLNKIAMMMENLIDHHDQIVIAIHNHASAVVPFIELGRRKNAQVIISQNVFEDINDQTKLIVVAQKNNTIDHDLNLEKLYQKAQKHSAFIINDAAQAIPHQKVSLQQADVIAFSSNKLYGPTGIGVLAIQKKLLNQIKPSTFGGGATSEISYLNWKGKGSIGDFEPGTPNTAGIIGFKAALEFFLSHDLEQLFEEEKQLAIYAYQQLETVEDVEIYSQKGDINLLFNLKKYNAQDVVSYLGHRKVILRAGTHCAHYLNKIIGQNSAIRLSISSYNNYNDIDETIKLIKEGGDFLDFI